MYGAGGKVYIYDSKGERALPDAVIELCTGVEILPGGEQYFYWGRTQDGERCYGIGSIAQPSQYRQATLPGNRARMEVIWSPNCGRAILRRSEQYFLWDWQQKTALTLPQGAEPFALSDDGRCIYSRAKNGQTNRNMLYVQEGAQGEAVCLSDGYKQLLFNRDGTQVLFTDHRDGYYLSCEGDEAEFLLRERAEEAFDFILPSGRIAEAATELEIENGNDSYLTETFEGMLLQTNQGVYRLGTDEDDTRLVLRTNWIKLGESGRNALYLTDGVYYYAEDILSDEAPKALFEQSTYCVYRAASPDLRHLYFYVTDSDGIGKTYYMDMQVQQPVVCMDDRNYTYMFYSDSFERIYAVSEDKKLYWCLPGGAPQPTEGLPAIGSLFGDAGGWIGVYAEGETKDVYRSIDGVTFTDTGHDGFFMGDFSNPHPFV